MECDRRKSDRDARKGDRDPPERFPQGEVTLDITEGKLFLHLIYGETECQPQLEAKVLSYNSIPI